MTTPLATVVTTQQFVTPENDQHVPSGSLGSSYPFQAASTTPAVTTATSTTNTTSADNAVLPSSPNVTADSSLLYSKLGQQAIVDGVDPEVVPEMIRFSRVTLDENGVPTVTDEFVEELAYVSDNYVKQPYGSSAMGFNSTTSYVEDEVAEQKQLVNEEIHQVVTQQEPLNNSDSTPILSSIPLERTDTADFNSRSTTTAMRSPSGSGSVHSNIAQSYGRNIDSLAATASSRSPILDSQPDAYLLNQYNQTETIRPSSYILDSTFNNNDPIVESTAAVHSVTEVPSTTIAPIVESSAVVEETIVPGTVENTTVNRRDGKRLVVVAVDDSASSSPAIRWALKQLLHSARDHLVVFTVGMYKTHGLFGTVNPDKSVQREQKAEIQAQRILDYCDKLILEWQEAESIQVSYELVSMKSADSKVRDVIVDYVRDVAADMLVMGAHSGGALKRTVVGSTSSYCQQHVTIPVVVVKEDGEVKTA